MPECVQDRLAKSSDQTVPKNEKHSATTTHTNPDLEVKLRNSESDPDARFTVIKSMLEKSSGNVSGDVGEDGSQKEQYWRCVCGMGCCAVNSMSDGNQLPLCDSCQGRNTYPAGTLHCDGIKMEYESASSSTASFGDSVDRGRKRPSASHCNQNRHLCKTKFECDHDQRLNVPQEVPCSICDNNHQKTSGILNSIPRQFSTAVPQKYSESVCMRCSNCLHFASSCSCSPTMSESVRNSLQCSTRESTTNITSDSDSSSFTSLCDIKVPTCKTSSRINAFCNTDGNVINGKNCLPHSHFVALVKDHCYLKNAQMKKLSPVKTDTANSNCTETSPDSLYRNPAASTFDSTGVALSTSPAVRSLSYDDSRSHCGCVPRNPGGAVARSLSQDDEAARTPSLDGTVIDLTEDGEDQGDGGESDGDVPSKRQKLQRSTSVPGWFGKGLITRRKRRM
jgi:hypothetical protein